jgi:hypothetical protein
LINLKKKKKTNKTKVSSGKPTGENKIIANNKKPANTTPLQAKRNLQ